MNNSISIQFIPTQQLQEIIPFWQLLDHNLSEEILLERLEEMIHQGYKCVGIYHQNKLIGVSGIWILIKYYIGKHLELDNVIILPEYQSKGIGKQLYTWILTYAKSIKCNSIELNCYVSNHAAQRFWINQGLDIAGYHFQKKLYEKN